MRAFPVQLGHSSGARRLNGGAGERGLRSTGKRLNTLNAQVNEFYQAGKFSEAVPVAQQALALAERLDGAFTPRSPSPSTIFALLHVAQGRYAEAEPLYKRSLAT